MHSDIFHAILLIGSTLLIYRETFAEQFTTESNSLEASEEFENRLVDNLQQDYHNGLEKIISLFNSIDTTIGKIETRLENLEKNANVLNATVNQRLLLHPRAKVYSGENYTGESEYIENVTAEYVNEKCGSLGKLSGRVKSIQTFGTCVRFFQTTVLSGWSLAIYPGSTIPEDVLTSKLEGVKGIGPCLPDEFDGATIDSLTQLMKKNHSDVRTTVPDLVEFFSFTKANKGIFMDTSGSSNKYLLGPFNRVEYLRKEVHKNDHDPTLKPTSAMESTAFYRSLNKLPGDVVGFGIPVALGGPANETFNIFPQTSGGAAEWLRITSDIPSFVTNNNVGVVVALNFMYENDNSTRPFGFYYYINYGILRTSYGRVRN